MLNIDKNNTCTLELRKHHPQPVDAHNATQHPIPLWNNRFLGFTFPPRWHPGPHGKENLNSISAPGIEGRTSLDTLPAVRTLPVFSFAGYLVAAPVPAGS